ncbi:MAG: hypothetical protein ACFFKA_20440, partial [Candidatus Thorarchaeota archaeon]
PSTIFWKYPRKSLNEPPKYGSMQFTLALNLYYPSNYYDCDEFIEISGEKGIMWINQCTSGGNFLSKSPQFPPIVVYNGGENNIYGEDLPRDWRYSFINSTEHFIDVIKNGGEPIYTGEQGRNLCIFAKLPYISHQQKRTVFWEEISVESEKDQSCIVEEPTDVNGVIFRKFLRDKRTDFKKGVEGGLKHKVFKYDKDIL